MSIVDARDHLDPSLRSWLDQVGDTGPASGAPFDVIDPGTSRILATIAAATPEHVDTAIGRARRAFDDGRWSETDADHREAVLHRLASLVERDVDRLSTIEALDTGKPLAEARLDIEEVAAVLRYYAGWCTKVTGDTIAAPRWVDARTIRRPVGICAAITPWNYPLPILTYKLAPALAFGNCFIAKPSELAPLSALYLAELCAEAGIPDDVVTILPGAADTGAALVSHPAIDKIAFTGSTATGRAVMRAAAERPTRVTLELGGKSPQVVFASADLAAAAAGVAAGIWTNAGQVCVAGSRLLVERAVAGELIERLTAHAAGLRLGHALDPAAQMGPMISARQRSRADAMIRSAVDAGAQRTEGNTPDDSDGFFLAPTILTDVPCGHPVECDEIFGPVLVVDTFDTEDEAVAKANATPYGLAAGVWTSRAGQGQRLARSISAGTVWVNTYGMFHPTLPFGGTKASGFGRELGPSVIDGYTDTTTVVENLDPNLQGTP